ncbi:MAG: HAD family hydrolase, partial [Ilumatobacteraceae bacterium]
MTTSTRILPSWRDGATRDAVVAFLDASDSLAPEAKVAAFDNDGTLWCERPAYAQLLFFVDQLRTAAAADPALADRAEYAAVLGGDSAAIGELGLARVAMALAELFDGMTPDEFTARVRDFMGRAQHPTLGIPLRRAVYQPMLELIAELRARGFSVFVVSGGGTEFVRAVSNELYGVLPDGVVGTLVEHEMHRDEAGRPVLRRTARLAGGANEGPE